MLEVTTAVRFLHLAASMLPLGIFTFIYVVGKPAAAKAGAPAQIAFAAFQQRQWRIAAASLAVVFISGMGTFAVQAANITGREFGQSLSLDNISAVLGTQFGKAWLLRQVILLLLAGVVAILIRRQRTTPILLDAGFALAAALVGTMALSSHAGAGEGMTLILQLHADALHLLGAGMWLGALLPLALLLEECRRADTDWAVTVAQEAAQRFSWLGIATVGTLVLTGLYNAWQLVGDIPPLVGTDYGHLLLIKLGLLLPLLALAATNLLWIRPRMVATASARNHNAFGDLVGHLRRNTLFEAGIGAAILAIVAVMGVTAPARHVQPEWPFSFRYNWEINKNLPEKRFPIMFGKSFPEQRISIFIGAGLAAAALLPLGYALFRRRYRRWALGIGVAAAGGGAALALPALWVDAYPTTYRRPAVPYQAISVESGLQTFQKYCVSCHGVAGFGDGPAGINFTPKPADLTARHTGDHTAGDLFWWLSHGKPNTAMPPFEGIVNEEARWDLVNFLRTLSAAEQARRMAPLVEPPWLVAPDFVYRTLRGENKSLKEHRSQKVVLLVLFTWPQSQARMAELQALQDQFSKANAAVLAVPADVATLDSQNLAALNRSGLDLIIDGSEETFATYGMFRRSLSEAGMRPDGPIPTHMEFLIDRQGYVRARWIAAESRGWSNTEILLRQIDRLNQEQPSAPAPDDHVH